MKKVIIVLSTCLITSFSLAIVYQIKSKINSNNDISLLDRNQTNITDSFALNVALQDNEDTLRVGFSNKGKVYFFNFFQMRHTTPVEFDDLDYNPIKYLNYFTTAAMPNEIFKKIKTSDGTTFYSAVRSIVFPNEWIYLERNMSNNDFNIYHFNDSLLSSKLLFDNNTCPTQEYAFKPIAWLNDNETVLIEAVIFGSSTENEGIWTYNLSNNEFKKLDLNKNYTGTPKLSPNHRYLLYNASTKSKDLHVSSNKIFVFDLLKRKEQLIFSEENAHITGLNWIK